jgi:hypothetical protein
MPIRMLLCVFAFSALASAKPVVTALDQNRIHAAYKEGDFDIVTKDLEKYAHDFQGRKWSREDSVFLYKHLAVIYTASPETREKGKYYMVSMLRIMPSAEILDMYVSEEVDRIFLRTRQEFLANMKLFGVDTASMNIPVARPSPSAKGDGNEGKAGSNGTVKAKASGGGSGWWWAAGGLTLAAAGAATYFVMQDQDAKPREEVDVIPVPAKK